MKNEAIDVIATTISGSIKDWAKVKHIKPLFKQHGFTNITLTSVDSHIKVRQKTKQCIDKGSRIIISAGGSGTFNATLEGCCDSGVNLDELKLGFLRKGSADLIGKTLGMPDNIEQAIRVFADSISNNKTIKCDVIFAEDENGIEKPRHFVGYGGAEIFGRIPYYTENRFIKFYKGLLSQFFGDLGPFFVGAVLASSERIVKSTITKKIPWRIIVDGQEVSNAIYQCLIIVNGDLGKDLPLAKSVPLGSGDFYLFGLRDLGVRKLAGQFKNTWNARILDNPDKWGFETYCIKSSLQLEKALSKTFDVNIDGATMSCHNSISFKITDQINLITK